MYSVSAKYKLAIKKPVVTSKITFDIGNSSYDETHILSGSFNIVNQCTDTSDITLGAVYIGELSATFINIAIPRNQWRNKVIKPYFELLVDEEEEEWERVPLGEFAVTEATYTRSGVDVKAYDNMRKFDRNFSLNQARGYLYDFLVVACERCNVSLAQTESQLKSLPNGQVYFNFYSDNDVETWRDLISWVAQTYGGYATINREGKLEIRVYSDNSIDTLGLTDRHDGGSFSDYVTRYTGLSYLEISSQTTRYTGATVDDGTSLALGGNPFLQTRNQAVTAIGNLLNAIAKIQYTPFKISTVGNPAYDLGDVITFTDGLAGEVSTCCLMKYEFNQHSKYTMSGYGANPDAATAKSKVDKNIAGLLAETSAKQMAFYELRNVGEYHLLSGAERKIVHLKLASNTDTRVEIHININLATLDTDANDITLATVTYIVDGDTITLKPEETYFDGNHVMHLMYILPMQANDIMYFEALMKATSGNITIAREGLWLYASGLGIVGDATWDGEIYIEDTPEPIPLTEMTFAGNVRETLNNRVWRPVSKGISDNTSAIGLIEISFAGNIRENIMINKKYISEITWQEANALTWANAYQDYIWGEVPEEE